jgi:hypothetical protein
MWFRQVTYASPYNNLEGLKLFFDEVFVLQSERKEKLILWFEELGKEDIPLVGEKRQI